MNIHLSPGWRGSLIMVFASALVCGLQTPLGAEVRPKPAVVTVSPHVGEMSADLPANPAGTNAAGRDALRFEPIDMIDDLFRSDIVLLMRHGPTDWSKLDIKDVAPTDCANQRILSPQGQTDMVNLGILLAGNGIRPSHIAVSEWCRGQQTLAALQTGFSMIAPDYAKTVTVETDPDLDLLLATQGAPTVTNLRKRIAAWSGNGASGPLLIISHFTNIDELTEFHVYEGEILVLDPKRKNRVLGYLRLKSAGPDVGHFGPAPEVAVP